MDKAKPQQKDQVAFEDRPNLRETELTFQEKRDNELTFLEKEDNELLQQVQWAVELKQFKDNTGVLCFGKGLGYVQKHETDVFVLVEASAYVGTQV